MFGPVSWLTGQNPSSPSRALSKKPSGLPKKDSPLTVAGAAYGFGLPHAKADRTEFPLPINVINIPNRSTAN